MKKREAVTGMAEQFVELTVLDGGAGDLEMTLTSAGHQWLEEVLPTLRAGTYNGDWAGIFAELIEGPLTNGWRWLRADAVAALTADWASTILSDQVEEDDQGHIVRVGRVWWYPQYETHDQLEELLRQGRLRFQRADDDGSESGYGERDAAAEP